MMNCTKCESSLSDSATHCFNCGTVVAAQSPPRSTQNPGDPFVGTVIDQKYRVDGRIGAGGMATVYRATRLMIGDAVAVKILHREQLSDPRVAERFRREAQAAARLKHPNVVTIYDFGVSNDGIIYLVMELVRGQSLRSTLKEQGPFTPTAAADVITQVCSALEEAHQQNIVHRDLKPDNIMAAVGDDGIRVKVLDFGIARMRDVAAMNLTQTGSVMGTPHYMSPEQCLGEELDGRSDIYSLGIVLYEMLAGIVPFNSPTSTAVIVQHVNQAPPPLRVLNVSISAGLEAVVLRALAKNRGDRPQSAKLFADELNAAVRGGGAPFHYGIAAAGVAAAGMPVSAPGLSVGAAAAPATSSSLAATIVMRTQPQGSSPTAPTALSQTPNLVPARSGKIWLVISAAAIVAIGAAIGITWKFARSATQSKQQTKESLPLAVVRPAPPPPATQTPLPSIPSGTPAPSAGIASVATADSQMGTPVRNVPSATPTATKLVVKSSPGGARVLIDNASAGTTDSDGFLTVKVPGGRHFVAIQKDGYQPWQSTIALASGSTPVEATLNPLPARLSVIPNVTGAQIEIAGIGTYQNQVSKMTVRAGRYQINVSRAGYRRFTSSVDLTPDGEATLPVTMEPLSVEESVHGLESQFQAQNFEGVINGGLDLINRDPANARLNRLVGLAYFQRRNYSQSILFLSKALDFGESFELPIKHHHRDPRGFGLGGDQFCDGTLMFQKSLVAFHSNCASEDFAVPSSKIYEVKFEPQKAGRVSIVVGISREKKREDRKTYNFHSPTAGLRPANPAQPEGIQNAYCDSCEQLTQLYYQLFSKAKQ